MSITPAQLAEAESIRSRLLSEAARHRSFCQSFNFQGDRAACGNVADSVETHVANAVSTPAQRPPSGGLLYRARQGDADALRRWNESSVKILAATTGAKIELQDNTIAQLVEDIATDARAAAGEVGFGFGMGAVVAAGLGVAYLVFMSPKR